MVSALVDELAGAGETQEAGTTRPPHQQAYRSFNAQPERHHLPGQSPVRFASTFMVTDSA
jgi:hypothetical protein